MSTESFGSVIRPLWSRETSSSPGAGQPQRIVRSRDLGAAVLLAVVTLVALGVQPTWLVELQQLEAYKIGSGVALAALLGYQWLLSFYRFKGRRRRASRQFMAHQRAAVLAPVLFYAHSVTLGYGYLLLLSTTYLGNVLVGLLNPQALRVHRRAYMVTWMVVHVSLSVLVVLLAGYHVWVALSYE